MKLDMVLTKDGPLTFSLQLYIIQTEPFLPLSKRIVHLSENECFSTQKNYNRHLGIDYKRNGIAM